MRERNGAGLVTSGTWADGVNVHGAHKNIRIEGCNVSHSGDDAYAIWSENGGDNGIQFHNSVVDLPSISGGDQRRVLRGLRWQSIGVRWQSMQLR